MSGLALYESLFHVLLSLIHGFKVHGFPGHPVADDVLCQRFASLMPRLYSVFHTPIPLKLQLTDHIHNLCCVCHLGHRAPRKTLVRRST